jgi:hypothetical protein
VVMEACVDVAEIGVVPYVAPSQPWIAESL